MTVKVFNHSVRKTVTHEDSGQVYRLGPGEMAELPKDVAEAICAAWKDVRMDGPAASQPAVEPWETRCGPAWEAAKKEHKIDFKKVVKTVGPQRPVVIEPPVPADAVDPVTGQVNEKLLNTHKCPQCDYESKKLGFVRRHQREVHGS